MCGKVEESILRRSLGRSPYFNRSLTFIFGTQSHADKKRTFAINSLFLNSPFTRVTFPFLSNSVQRSRGSFVAFAARPRPIVKPPSVPSSISAGPPQRLCLSAEVLLRLRSRSLRRSGRLLVEADREYGAFEKGKIEDERPAWPVQSQIRGRELL
jgi:hypothetical protein